MFHWVVAVVAVLERLVYQVDPVVVVVVLAIALFMPAGPELLDKDLMAVLVNTSLEFMKALAVVAVLVLTEPTHRALLAELVVMVSHG